MRPLGVTLVGFYQILRGVIGVLFGLAIMAFTSFAARMATLAVESTAIGRLLHGFGHLVGLTVIVFSILHLVAGYGVLGMRNWGRLLTLLFSAAGLVLLLPGLAHGHIVSLVFGFINGACIFYLAMPPVKRAFHSPASPVRATA